MRKRIYTKTIHGGDGYLGFAHLPYGHFPWRVLAEDLKLAGSYGLRNYAITHTDASIATFVEKGNLLPYGMGFYDPLYFNGYSGFVLVGDGFFDLLDKYGIRFSPHVVSEKLTYDFDEKTLPKNAEYDELQFSAYLMRSDMISALQNVLLELVLTWFEMNARGSGTVVSAADVQIMRGLFRTEEFLETWLKAGYSSEQSNMMGRILYDLPITESSPDGVVRLQELEEKYGYFPLQLEKP